MRQLEAGVLNVGYAEVGPAGGPVVADPQETLAFYERVFGAVPVKFHGGQMRSSPSDPSSSCRK
jgi:hypothetical protein